MATFRFLSVKSQTISGTRCQQTANILHIHLPESSDMPPLRQSIKMDLCEKNVALIVIVGIDRYSSLSICINKKRNLLHSAWKLDDPCVC